MARIRDLWKNRDGSKSARHGKGKRWCVVWVDPAGAEKSKSFHRKPDAERYAATVEADMARGAYVDPARGRITLAEYVEKRWKPAQHHLGENSMTTYDRHWRVRIEPRLGHRQLGSLTRADVKRLVAEVKDTTSTSTLYTTVATLRVILASAVDDELIVANPCARVKLPKREQHDVTVFTAEQVRALADAIHPRFRLAVILAAGAGLRQGEALGLTKARVEFLRRRLLVRKQMQNGALVDVKTGAGRRTVPLDDGILAEVTEHMKRFPPRADDGVLITNPNGSSVLRNRFGDVWRAAVRKAGMPKGTRYHDLRHYYASAQIAAGVNAKAIQSRMGHATISETFDTYGHLMPDHEDLGRGAMDAALGFAV
ncbi:site-specific integrase [Streptomonospora sp. PA3]|uniref:tyrosine-type recombinase/integrase n=1 Tax=Streptomonospora sp. PA3 TaxID=2607326 RepID=UPI001643327B|nr:site-specific integrase [Streptomonospora sp. PA3]